MIYASETDPLWNRDLIAVRLLRKQIAGKWNTAGEYSLHIRFAGVIANLMGVNLPRTKTSAIKHTTSRWWSEALTGYHWINENVCHGISHVEYLGNHHVMSNADARSK